MHTTRQINLRGVAIGGGAEVSVQTMTNTDTRDVAATCAQIERCVGLGAQIVRLAIPDREAADSFAQIRKRAPDIPLVADIHFDYRLALAAINAGADGLRLNPGNIGGAENVRAVVKAAKPLALPIRVGVNAGSAKDSRPETLVELALSHVALLEAEDYPAIKISVKASDVATNIAAYRLLSSRTEWPLHLGLTEAGTLLAGTVRSCVAMSELLREGIGDTLRVSLTDSPENEVRVAQELLAALGLRKVRGATVVSCPTCGRTKVDLIGTAHAVEERLAPLAAKFAPLPKVAVMGCVVNGPGEARDADIALCGGNHEFVLFVGGKPQHKVSEAAAPDAVIAAVKDFCASR